MWLCVSLLSGATFDYKNLNCLEINLSNQTLETLEKFLLEENTDRKWVNNQECFDNIKPCYQKANKRISVKYVDECEKYELYYDCIGVRQKRDGSLLVIENSGKRYRICKPELYDIAIEERRKKQNAINQEGFFQIFERKYRDFSDVSEERIRLREKQRHKENIQTQLDADRIPPSERTCFMCKCNLAWRNRPDVDIAHCGPYIRMGVPENTPPDTAKRVGDSCLKDKNS